MGWIAWTEKHKCGTFLKLMHDSQHHQEAAVYTHRALEVGKNKVAALLPRLVGEVEDGAMLAAELTVHDAQVGLMRPAEHVGAPGGVDVDELPPHGPLGAVNGDLLLGFVDVLHVEDGVSCREGCALAQDPALGVEGKEADLLSGGGPVRRLVLAPPYGHDLGLADTDGGVSAVAADVPPGGHGGPQGVEGGLLSVEVGEAGEDPRRRACHGVVHPAADVVRGG